MRRRKLAVLAVVGLLFVASRADASQAAGSEIIVQFLTGGDDLRGGNDDVDLLPDGRDLSRDHRCGIRASGHTEAGA